jgi:hypothetical protein
LDGQACRRLLEPVALALKPQHHAAVHQPVRTVRMPKSLQRIKVPKKVIMNAKHVHVLPHTN